MFVEDIPMHYIVDYHLICIYGVQAGLVHFLTILISIMSIFTSSRVRNEQST